MRMNVVCGLLLAIAMATPAREYLQDRANWSEVITGWAQRTGLSNNEVEGILRAAGLHDSIRQGAPDTTLAPTIEALDRRSLAARSEVLLVTADGNGHCLTLHVLKRKGSQHTEVWTFSELPGGAGLCRMSPSAPAAAARSPDEILVRVPVFDYVRCRALPDRMYVFRARVGGYALAKQYSTTPLAPGPFRCDAPGVK